MRDIIKVLTGAWAMTDVWAYDILIKATIRAGHIMTNFLHSEPREHNLLTRYVNGVANTSVLGCGSSRDGDQWKTEGDQYERTWLWLIDDSSGISNESSLLADNTSPHSLHFKQCRDILQVMWLCSLGQGYMPPVFRVSRETEGHLRVGLNFAA